MKKIILVLILLSIAGGVLYWQRQQIPFLQKASDVQYTCSMHPQVVQDKPGFCPICGMKLVPMESHQHQHAEGTYLISPERRQLIGVRVAPVEIKELKREIRLPGRVAYDEELYITEKEYVNGLRVDMEEDVLKTIENKLTRLGISKEELTRLRKTKKEDSSLFLPQEGGSFWVYAHVYEADLSWVSRGMKANITLPKEPSVVLDGEVKQITPVVDPMTRTALARVLISKPKISLKPETYVDVVLQKELGKMLALPADAVIETGTSQMVFVDLGEGYIEPREVKLGEKATNDFPILEGLKEGESVITSAHFLVDSEAQLQAVMKRFGEMPAGHHH